MNNLKFEDLPSAMESVLDKLSNLEEELRAIKENFQPKEPDELMTRKEVAEYFKVDLSTIWNWSKNGKLTYYGLGSRVYYKRSQIEKSLTKINR